MTGTHPPIKTYPAYTVKCPCCGALLGDGMLQDLFDDPFNGTNIDCPGCGDSLKLDVMVAVRSAGGDDD